MDIFTTVQCVQIRHAFIRVTSQLCGWVEKFGGMFRAAAKCHKGVLRDTNKYEAAKKRHEEM